jgi:hypothetical protein
MHLDKMWKLAGNCDRISELTEAGYGPNAISGIFNDNGIEISAGSVRAIQESLPELTAKGLPKSVCKQLINSQETTDIQFS